MEKKYKRLVKDTLIFALGSVGSKIILFFLVPLYTNYLTSAEYGTVELILSYSSLVIPFAGLVINHAVIRFGMKRGIKKENVILSAFAVWGYSIVFSLVIVFAFGQYATLRQWKWYFFAYVILFILLEIERCYLKVKEKNKMFAVISIIQTGTMAITNIVLIAVLHMGIRGYLMASLIAMGICIVIILWMAEIPKDLAKASWDFDLLKQMARYSTPLIFSSISWWVIHSSDKLMIEWMIGASALGIYTVATKIPSLINVIIGFFNQAWALSSIREMETTNDGQFYIKTFRFFSVILFGACIFFTSFMKPFMNIYVGQEFKEAWKYVPYLLVAAVFFAISAFVETLFSTIQKTKSIMWTTIMCALINVSINYFGIKCWGVWGAIAGTVISYFFIATVRLVSIGKYIYFQIDMWTYVVNILLIVTQALFVSIDWHQYYMSTLVMICFVINNRDTIKRCMVGINGMIKKQMKMKKHDIS